MPNHTAGSDTMKVAFSRAPDHDVPAGQKDVKIVLKLGSQPALPLVPNRIVHDLAKWPGSACKKGQVSRNVAVMLVAMCSAVKA